MRRVCAVLGLTLAGTLAGGSLAYAQGGGVFIDPDGPTAKEYAIPLESERRRASGDPGRGEVPRADPLPGETPSATKAEPFGRGINRSVARRARRAAEPADDGKGLPGTAVVARIEGEAASPALATSLAAAGILGLGLLGGVFLRRSRRR